MTETENRPAAEDYDLARTSESVGSDEYIPEDYDFPPEEFEIPPELLYPEYPEYPEEEPSQQEEEDQNICPLWVRELPYVYWLTLHLVWDLLLMICAIDF